MVKILVTFTLMYDIFDNISSYIYIYIYMYNIFINI